MRKRKNDAKDAQSQSDNTRMTLTSETLEPRMMLSTVQLFAGGFDGTEQIQLQIDEVAVETFSLEAGGDAGQFSTFTFETEDTITADQVRVAFLNDRWDPDNDIDSNVRLDAIEIDGQRFETEDASVFSTGTWLPEDGIQPGFRESEILHTTGFFQFADDSPVDTPVDPPVVGDIVINEIHYNPGPDDVVDPDAEFVELFNRGDTDFDLSGASFDGFDLTFAEGTILAAGEYAIVGPSIEIAEATWGVTPIAEFAGGAISGGGERIALIAADGVTVIDEVTYDDTAPWPGGPDGNGPSLELRDPTLDNTLPTSWATSNGDPTPGAQNSVFGESGVDLISDIIVNPGQPLANQDFTISANIQGATTATLFYRIGFNGEEIPVEMINIGGDLWQATVPGQAEGELVRYRIESDVAVAPFANDTINYLGVVVDSPDIVDSTLPLFQFFVDDAQFEELTTTDLRLTNTRIPTVIVWDGQVIDNAEVRVRGGDFSRANFPKLSLQFELPDGFTLDFGTGYGVDEFGVNADFSDFTFAATDIAWQVFNEQTASQVQSFNLRVENNGQFHGVFRFQELYDGAYREFNGFGDDEFFQAENGGFDINPNFDKANPDDGNFDSISEINDILFWLPDGSEAQTAWLYENVDIPSVINHMALSALTRHDDQADQNFYMARDAESGLWSVIEWDLDRLWIANEDVPTDFTDISVIGADLLDAVFAVPEFQEMYWRRMQTIVDTYLSDEGVADLLARREEQIAEIGATNSRLEFERWGRVDIFQSDFFREEWEEVILARQTAFANETRLPGSASGITNIVINELHYNPAGDDAEFIELFNDSDESVDLSGWQLDGVGHTFEFGTVILPNETLVFTDNLPQFRQQYPGNIALGGQYSGGLSGGGETITLLDASGNVIDVVDYDDSAPFPTSPDGEGFSLSLIDPSLDNNLASSWVASTQLNGTPGIADNSTTFETTEISIFAAGMVGDEVIRLDIAGQDSAAFVLSSFGGEAGDLAARNFAELTFSTSQPVTADDIRINFLNDIPEDGTGISRDVAIDRIEINGEVFQTEDPSVFSTGTFNADGELLPGFLQSEVLQAVGFFQFADTGASTGDPNTITVFAAGSTADEIITLEIAGDVVATYDLGENGGLAGDFLTGRHIPLTFTSDAPINASDVRINFINDATDPVTGLDNNVSIDRIEIGGEVFETEAPTTFSTGTFVPGVGVEPGFVESQILTNNGFFQFLFDPNADPGDDVGDPNTITVFAAGSTADEIITLEIAGEVAATFNLGENGGLAGDFLTGRHIPLTFTSDAPINASDVRINFINDATDPVTGLDNNVSIDRIEIGGEVFETEAPTTFSTGTFVPGVGVEPGFVESQILTNNGFFQFLFVPNANNNPTAGSDFFESSGESVSGNLLVNDSDIDGDSLSIVSNTNPGNGSVNVSANGDFTYTPNDGFTGTDSFSYVVGDELGGTTTGNVSIEVTANSIFADGNVIQFTNVQFNSQLRALGVDTFTWNSFGTDTHWEVVNPDGDDQLQLRNVDNGRYLDGDEFDVDTQSSGTNLGTTWELQEINPGQYHIYNTAFNDVIDAQGVIAAVIWDQLPRESDDLWTINVISTA